MDLGVKRSRRTEKEKNTNANPVLAVIQPPMQRVEKLDLYSRAETKVQPHVAYWASELLYISLHKSLPGLSILDHCHRIFVSQNGLGNFLLYSGCDVVFKAKEGLGHQGKPLRKTITLYDNYDEKVLEIERVGKQGLECKVTCLKNRRVLGNLLQVGVKKSTFLLGNEHQQKICQIQKTSKRTYFMKNKDAGLIEYEFRTVNDEPVGGGITFIGTLGYFGKVGNPKTCAVRFPSTVGPAEKALFVGATFFFDFLEFKAAKDAELGPETQVVPFAEKLTKAKALT